MLKCFAIAIPCLLLLDIRNDCFSQQDSDSFHLFGYFQTAFQHRFGPEVIRSDMARVKKNIAENSFNVQQLNLFIRRDLGLKWRVFINFEVLNSYSSLQNWGAFNLEEAWIKYRANEKFSLKLGLLIPTFNNLNEIKNRTPLLPYIIRPIAYETSFGEFIAVEDYTPTRAFLQAYGFLSFANLKLDYSAFLGNGPNINADPERGQTGVDTTDTILAGGRVGIRVSGFKFGFSLTRDNESRLSGDSGLSGIASVDELREIPRTRTGGDFSYNRGPLGIEAEFITLKLANQSRVDLERNFWYGTVSYRVSEPALLYFSFWKVDDLFQVDDANEETLRFDIPTVGLAYTVNERITFKAQYARAKIRANVLSAAIADRLRLNYFSVATSVIF